MSFDTQTKLAVYRHFAETGNRPSVHVVAERIGSDVNSVRDAYGRLRAQRVLVLDDGWNIHSDGATIFWDTDSTCRDR
jgi:DNA-directed RNA polymerase specialized sigma subunit